MFIAILINPILCFYHIIIHSFTTSLQGFHALLGSFLFYFIVFYQLFITIYPFYFMEFFFSLFLSGYYCHFVDFIWFIVVLLLVF